MLRSLRTSVFPGLLLFLAVRASSSTAIGLTTSEDSDRLPLWSAISLDIHQPAVTNEAKLAPSSTYISCHLLVVIFLCRIFLRHFATYSQYSLSFPSPKGSAHRKMNGDSQGLRSPSKQLFCLHHVRMVSLICCSICVGGNCLHSRGSSSFSSLPSVALKKPLSATSPWFRIDVHPPCGAFPCSHLGGLQRDRPPPLLVLFRSVRHTRGQSLWPTSSCTTRAPNRLPVCLPPPRCIPATMAVGS